VRRARQVVPDEAKLAAAITAAGEAPTTAYVDTVADKPLLEKLPARGRIVKRTTNEALGLTEWTLSNGVRVVLKPTTFKQDQILMRAVSPGGTSLAPDADYVPALTADDVISQADLDRSRRRRSTSCSPGRTPPSRPTSAKCRKAFAARRRGRISRRCSSSST
jgi:zinc protease